MSYNCENHFYDIHCHSFNLAHANITAFVRHFFFPFLGLEHLSVIKKIRLFFSMPVHLITKITNVFNLLSLMENDIGNFYLLMEKDILKSKVYREGMKFIITPLLMDFDAKEKPITRLHYGQAPKKPITEQLLDILSGIRDYRKLSEKKIMEIYPFLGINPANYDFQQLTAVLGKYFSGYVSDYLRFEKKYNQHFPPYGNHKWKSYNGELEKIGSFYFSGLKLYPPLGFNPWPQSTTEAKKVNYLYQFCCAREIPITTHCDDGGFEILESEKKDMLTNPYRLWTEVLKHYPNLKINFAHMGFNKTVPGKIKRFLSRFSLFPKQWNWTKKILQFIKEYDNVFTDFSCNGFSLKFYRKLAAIISKAGKKNSKVKERILFGSDFMINLIWINSYEKYLNLYQKSKALQPYREIFARDNPFNFLFGKSIKEKACLKYKDEIYYHECRYCKKLKYK